MLWVFVSKQLEQEKLCTNFINIRFPMDGSRQYYSMGNASSVLASGTLAPQWVGRVKSGCSWQMQHSGSCDHSSN